MRQKAAKYLGTKEICLVFFMKHIQLGFLPFLFAGSLESGPVLSPDLVGMSKEAAKVSL